MLKQAYAGKFFVFLCVCMYFGFGGGGGRVGV